MHMRFSLDAELGGDGLFNCQCCTNSVVRKHNEFVHIDVKILSSDEIEALELAGPLEKDFVYDTAIMNVDVPKLDKNCKKCALLLCREHIYPEPFPKVRTPSP